MTTIDNRVVQISFDNAAFEKRVATTMTSLSTLNNTINGLTTNTRGADIGKSMNLDGIGSAVDNISSKFSALGAIGFTVIQKLTTEALGFISRVGGTVLDPLIAGGRRRAENIEQALFQFRGLGLDAAAAMESARLAVTGTAFGLDVAAKAAAQFGASGIEVGDEMTGALRGIAGVAAMTNTSFEEMSDVFTSAAGVGKISGNTLNRIAVRGMNAAAALAKEWGLSEAEVRRMASDGEISFKMFAEGMDAAFGEHATKANETYAGSLANVRAALSRIGASFFGKFLTQQRDVFNALAPVIDNVGEALEPVVDFMLKLTNAGTGGAIKFLNGLNLAPLKLGMESLVKGFGILYSIVWDVGRVIKNAFQDIFPTDTSRTFLSITNAFKEFADRLRPTGETLLKIRNIFTGFFSVLSIGWTVVKELVKTVASLFDGLVGFAGSGVLGFFSDLGLKLGELQTKLVKEGGIAEFFDSIRGKIDGAIAFLNMFKNAVKASMAGVSDAFEGVKNRWSEITEGFSAPDFDFKKLLGPFEGVATAIGNVLDEVWLHIKTWFSELGAKMGDEAEAGDWDKVMDAISVGLLGGIAVILSKFLKDGLGINLVGDGIFGDLSKTIFGAGSLDSLNGVLDSVKNHLNALTAEVKSEALLKIAGAVAILAVAVLILSTIDPVDLTKALAAMTYGFGNLVGVLTLITKLQVGPLGAGGMVVIATGMILLATAVTVLSVAILMLSSLSLSELAKGLLGMVAALGALVGAAKLLTAMKGGMFVTSLSLIALAVAIGILAVAMRIFASMDFGQLAQGLAGMASALILVAEAMKIMPPNMAATAVGLMLVGAALIVLAVAMRIFATMDFEQLARGLAGMASALVLIASAMKIMPPNMAATAASLLLMAGAVLVMGVAMKIFASMNFEELARGLAGMASALLLLVTVMPLMSGGLGGAAALGIIALSLLGLSVVMKEFARLSIGESLKALLGMGVMLAAIAAAAYLMLPVVPAILALGIALSVLGIAFALFGAGAYMVAKAFVMLGKAGEASIDVLLKLIDALVLKLPEMAKAFALALVQMANEFLQGVPIILEQLGVLVAQVIDTLVELIPKFVELIATLITTLLEYIIEMTPLIVEAGYAVLLALLQGLSDNIEEIIEIVSDIVMAFVEGLMGLHEDLRKAGVDFLVKLIEGIGEGMEDIITAGVDAVLSFVQGIADNINKVVDKGFEIVINFINTLAETIRTRRGELASAGANLLDAIFGGITEKAVEVAGWFMQFPMAIIGWIGDMFGPFLQKGRDVIGGVWEGATAKMLLFGFWLTGLGGKVLGYVGNGLKWLYQVGRNVISGLWNGMGSLKDWIWEKAKGVAGWITNPIGKALEIFSPSRVFMRMGKHVGEGLVIGIDKMRKPIEASSRSMADAASENFVPDGKTMSNNMKNALTRAIDDAMRIVENVDGATPTITPVLDLSKVQSGAKSISGLIGDNAKLLTDSAYLQASAIAATRVNDETDTSPERGSGEVKFEQNIFAPEQLSTADIYRQTNNQIQMAKEELRIP